MNILFVISEVEDIIKTGGLADVGKALPIALQARGHKIALVLPYYKQLMPDTALVDALPTQSLFVNGSHYQYKVKELNLHGLTCYLIDHVYFSESRSAYEDTSHANNAQKFSFLCLAALQTSHFINFKPDVIHSNDWHTAMVSYFVKSDFLARHQIISPRDFFENSKSVLTIHNAAFQGIEKLNQVPLLDEYAYSQLEVENADLNMLKNGIAYADHVCAVSPSYAQELKTHLGSHGLFEIINRYPDKVHGVLNGCDYSQWDPSIDEYIPVNFDIDSLEKKQHCKKALQKRAALPILKNTPLIGMVCRVTRQKGFEFIIPIIAELLQHKVQVVIMGTGQKDIVDRLREQMLGHSDKAVFIEAFEPQLAHLIEAGADFFLMPSEFEPCGLNQMYSLAYGTLPIVRAVGGLADTVNDFNAHNANGFVFKEPNSEALLSTLRKALLIYNEYPSVIKKMRLTGMQTRFTWESSAQNYEKLYNL